ncbi:MAG TPA: FAD-linked oxidase C-terminal domain-containing protein [Conexibacter sp.]|jgi:glycolate oxidase subunit GlcD|nr:FAD-linked oxidase C-terminal domain-containing protein [Conexibacter sp.]
MKRSLETALRAFVGDAGVADAGDARFWRDATESQGLEGRPDAVVVPGSAEEVAAVMRWCYAQDVPIVPRGGGSGFSGGCVPVNGGVVLALDRMTRVKSFDPLLWRMHVEAGLRTSEVRRLARENGLSFPPDPGAAEQSQIGGNVATNAGGPHAFKYGVTGRWVTGIEAVIPPGELIEVGGSVRKDVAGYDLKSLLIGSEGTLGIVTAVWLRLIPAPQAAAPVIGVYRDVRAGCAAIEAILGSGIQAAAIEFLDAGALSSARGAYPFDLPEGADFMVLAEADGSRDETAAVAFELREALADQALAVHAPKTPADVAALWRWRDGVSIAVEAVRGGKVSEDVAVPLDRLGDAIEATLSIGARHALEACSWGHAGDGNLHATFLVDPRAADELDRAHAASVELYEAAAALGGTISGEHGLGWVKRGHLDVQWAPATLGLHQAIKQTLDPKNLMNPGKKT